MAVPTITDVSNLDFGYLKGLDLLGYCPYQIIIKQMATIQTAPDIAVNLAYNEIVSALSSSYNIEPEYQKRGAQRYGLLVKLTTIAAVRNICSNLNGVPENILQNFQWLDKTLLALRNGQMSLIGLQKPGEAVKSSSYMVTSSFETLG
jgi:hypothetical protein